MCLGKKHIVKRRHGTVVYHIHNLVVNINADVVTQLNTNPQQIINVIQDQVRTEIGKMNLSLPEADETE